MTRRRRGLWAVTVGSPLCPDCGEEAVEQRRATAADRLWYWLRFGGSAPETARCANGHEWAGAGQASLYPVRTGGPRWLWLPVELLRVLHGERTMVPVPLTYLVAAGIGIVVGVILDLVVGWAWWLVAVGFVAAVWLVFLSSAFWGRGGSLMGHMRTAIDPEGSHAAELARLEAAVAGGRLVCFELDGWEGTRSLRGWGGVTEPTGVTLLHGDMEHDDTWVSVETRQQRGPADPIGPDRHDELFRELLHALNRPPAGFPIEQLQRWHFMERKRIDEIDAPPWSPITVRIDGHDVAGEVAATDDGWALITASSGNVIELIAQGRRPASITLGHVTTLRPYVEGLEALQQRHRLEYGP